MKTALICVVVVLLSLTALATLGGYLLGRMSRHYPPAEPEGPAMAARFVLAGGTLQRVAICARCYSRDHHVSDCPEMGS